MSRVLFRCPSCAETVPAPASLAGHESACPKCKAVVRWPQPERSGPPPLPNAVPKPAPRPPRPAEPERDEDDWEPVPSKPKWSRPTDGAILTCYLLTAGSIATGFTPCIWFLSVPATACAFALSLYLTCKYKCPPGVIACLMLSAIFALVMLNHAAWVSEKLRRGDF